MSYIRAKNVDRSSNTSVSETTYTGTFDIDANLDDEMLFFVLELIEEVNNLRDGEALVVWKEIF